MVKASAFNDPAEWFDDRDCPGELASVLNCEDYVLQVGRLAAVYSVVGDAVDTGHRQNNPSSQFPCWSKNRSASDFLPHFETLRKAERAKFLPGRGCLLAIAHAAQRELHPLNLNGTLFHRS